MDFLVDLRPLLKMAFRASWLTSTLTPSCVTEKLKATAAWASAMLTKAEEEAQNNALLSTEKKNYNYVYMHPYYILYVPCNYYS